MQTKKDLHVSNNGKGQKKKWKRRATVRERVIDAFMDEAPGKGTGKEATKYIYYVETLKSGDRIYLKRPARRHYGFDFLICVEKMSFSGPAGPSYKELLDDLRQKKKENPAMYKKLRKRMKKIYACKAPKMTGIQFKSGWSPELILKLLKWMFIEQDIRYWNYSGRKKLWTEISQI